jgi:hypothetical protein
LSEQGGPDARNLEKDLQSIVLSGMDAEGAAEKGIKTVGGSNHYKLTGVGIPRQRRRAKREEEIILPAFPVEDLGLRLLEHGSLLARKKIADSSSFGNRRLANF